MTKTEKLAALATITTLSFMQSNAIASTMGGLAKGQAAAEDIKTGLYALVGVLAVIYLLYLAVMAFTEKKSWSDFGWGVLYVGIAGAAANIAGWAWTLFA